MTCGDAADNLAAHFGWTDSSNRPPWLVVCCRSVPRICDEPHIRMVVTALGDVPWDVVIPLEWQGYPVRLRAERPVVWRGPGQEITP